MRRSRQWATEIELLATATYFNTTITEQYPFGTNSLKWINIKPLPLHKDDPSYDGILLEGKFHLHHTLGVHYNSIFPQ